MLKRSQARLLATSVHLPPGYRTMAETRALIAAADSPFVPPPGALELSGIRGVHVKGEQEQCSDLAATAAGKALAAAGTPLDDVDLLLFASSGQDLIEPATAHIVAAKLGATCPAFDVKNACNSVLNALQVARALIESGQYRTVLITCGEAPTLAIRWHLPDLRAFRAATPGYTVSDAGAAMLLTAGPAGEREPGVLATVFSAESASWDVCTVVAGGSMHPRGDDEDVCTLRLNGDLVETGRRHMPLFAERHPREIALMRESAFVAVHQISLPQYRRCCAEFGVPEERSLPTVVEHGNVASASLPLQLALAQESGRAGPGDLVALAGLASGFSVGLALIRL
ncbi:3-oxoacyl-ACP synthase [Streptomyces armeniacus]|uniref:3-oxoacyl-ACP synthase n=1 Tax=Streptomyces armeniacus TaxID=83291 RepID=A0A345XR63_9ACTN|nr:3-oxoacyl-[acyl-carrier-protein] synthase III C-terminal domain-containing protein [Streptomyces armeniacus]AXK34129.1 3-oxoacyl-ACP synthase [Streptomyces armeniacus]